MNNSLVQASPEHLRNGMYVVIERDIDIHLLGRGLDL